MRGKILYYDKIKRQGCILSDKNLRHFFTSRAIKDKDTIFTKDAEVKFDTNKIQNIILIENLELIKGE